MNFDQWHIPIECPPLSPPDLGTFSKGHVVSYQRPGSQLTPVCNKDYFKASRSLEKLICQVHGEWTDEKGNLTLSSDWNKEGKSSVCQGIQSICVYLLWLTNILYV
jgi:hypothetical protein